MKVRCHETVWFSELHVCMQASCKHGRDLIQPSSRHVLTVRSVHVEFVVDDMTHTGLGFLRVFQVSLSILISIKCSVSLFYYPGLVQWSIFDSKNRSTASHYALRTEQHRPQRKPFASVVIMTWGLFNSRDFGWIRRLDDLRLSSVSEKLAIIVFNDFGTGFHRFHMELMLGRASEVKS